MVKHPPKIFGSFVLGAAVGVVTGLLVAPRQGQVTRQLLSQSMVALPDLAEDWSEQAHDQVQRLSGTTRQMWENTLTHLRVAVVAGIEAAKVESQVALGQMNSGATPPPVKTNQPSN